MSWVLADAASCRATGQNLLAEWTGLTWARCPTGPAFFDASTIGAFERAGNRGQRHVPASELIGVRPPAGGERAS